MSTSRKIFGAVTKKEIGDALKVGGNINSYISGTPLIVACINNEYETVNNLIEMGADVEMKVPVTILNNEREIDYEWKNINALELMVTLENKDMIELLLKNGANPNTRFDTEEMADINILQYAIEGGFFGIVEILVKYGATIRDDHEIASALIHTIIDQNLDILDFMLSIFPNVNLVTQYGDTPLLEAINTERLDIVDRLLVSGANVNCVITKPNNLECFNMYDTKYIIDNVKTLPIYAALDRGNIDVCKRILDMGVNLDVYVNSEPFLIYIYKKEQILEELFYLLFDYPCDINVMDNEQRTLLTLAIEMSNMDTIKILLDKGANINVNSKLSKSAVKYADVDVLNFLLENNMDINLYEDLLYDAVNKNSYKKVKLLLEYGSNPNISPKILEKAISYGNLDMIKLLLDYGANPIMSYDLIYAIGTNRAVIEFLMSEGLI